MTGGRPLRALALLVALLGGWVAGRWPAMEHDVAQLAAATDRPADRLPTPQAVRRAVALPFAVSAVMPAPIPTVAARLPSTPAVMRATARSRPMAGTPHSLPATAVAMERPDAALATSSIASAAGATPFAPPARVPAGATAFEQATRAYVEIAQDRRAAARDFAAAIAADPQAAQAGAWAIARRALTRRWSASAYTVVRATGAADPGVSALLGGGQSGGQIAFTPDPLAIRPVSLTARLSAANDRAPADAEAAVGVRLQLRRGLSISGERIVAAGPQGRNAWTARVAAGGAWTVRRIDIASYGEAGIVTTAPLAAYAAGTARASYPVVQTHGLTIAAGGGVWASIQRGGADVDRVDLGPGVRLGSTSFPVAATLDYRFRVAGNARPGSGPVLTVTAGF